MPLQSIFYTTVQMNFENASLILLIPCLHFTCIILSMREKKNQILGLVLEAFHDLSPDYAPILISHHSDTCTLLFFYILYFGLRSTLKVL